MKQEFATFIEYGEVEKLVKQVYGVEYEMACDLEASNDTAKIFNVKPLAMGEERWDKWELKDWEDFLAGKPKQWMAYRVIEHLVDDGHIPAGKIVVDISW